MDQPQDVTMSEGSPRLASFVPIGTIASSVELPTVAWRMEAARGSKVGLEIVVVPPAFGLIPILDSSLHFIGRRLASVGCATTVLSFAGQYQNPGVFSVAKSCFELRLYIERICGPFFLIGFCTGALASLAATVDQSNAEGVFAWDLSARIRYCEPAITSLEKKYKMRFCPETALLDLQASQFVPFAKPPILFGHPTQSYYTTSSEQVAMAQAARMGVARRFRDFGHFPGVPRGSERHFAEIIVDWVNGGWSGEAYA